ADVQEDHQNGCYDLLVLAERREGEYAADHEDVNRPVPLQSNGSLEVRLNQLTVFHGTSRLWTDQWALVRVPSRPRAARGKCSSPTPWWRAGGHKSAARRW